MLALDTTIVNVALPHIQAALGFSGPNLEWVVNAYAVAFGGNSTSWHIPELTLIPHLGVTWLGMTE